MVLWKSSRIAISVKTKVAFFTPSCRLWQLSSRAVCLYNSFLLTAAVSSVNAKILLRALFFLCLRWWRKKQRASEAMNRGREWGRAMFRTHGGVGSLGHSLHVFRLHPLARGSKTGHRQRGRGLGDRLGQQWRRWGSQHPHQCHQ